MATYNGDRYEVAENLAPATEDILTRGLWDGKLRVCVDEWTAATKGDNNLSNGDYINVARIPAGGTFLFGRLISDDLGANDQKLHVGYGAAANQFTANEDATSAIDTTFGSPVSFDDDTVVKVKLSDGGGGSNATANAEIKTIIVYSSE